jgi:phage shock protein A
LNRDRIEADIALATNAIQEDDSFVAQRTKEVRVLKKNIAKLNRKIAAIRKKDQSVVVLYQQLALSLI